MSAEGSNPGRKPKFRRRAEARPDEVLDAALELFIEKGYAATRVEDIAKRAGISKGSVYLYFASKEAVIEALVRRELLPVAANAAAIMAHAQGDPRAGLSAMLRMFARRLGDPRVLAIPKLILREVVNFPELAEMYKREVIAHALPMMEGVVAKGIADGVFRPVDAELVPRSILGPVLMHLMMAEVFDITPRDGLALERFIENHLDILFNGLAAKESGDA